jgi:hypothetical protein
MFQVLDTATLLRLLDAPGEAVLQTLETGVWSGCIWPGNAEWDMHEACAQVRSLTIHYVTVRHPAAELPRYEALAQVLASQACPRGPHGHLDGEPLVQQALLWLWVLAGGPSLPETPESKASIPLPGGDPIAFTEAGLALLDALLFSGKTAAEQVASDFLRRQGDNLSQRAFELLAMLTHEETAQAVEAGVICASCGMQDLDLWYSGQTWGETLCETCYETRVRTGRARAQEG